MLLGLVARQRHQPGLGFRRDRRLLARSRSVVEGRQCAIGDGPLDAALDRLMMHAKSASHGKERRLLPIAEQHRRPRYPARRLGPRPRQSRQCFNLLPGHRQLDRLPPSCHDATPRSINHKRGIHQQMIRSMISFTEWSSRPSQAAKSHPLANEAPLPMAATIALAMIGPMPGTVINCRQLSVPRASCSISSVTQSIRSSRRRNRRRGPPRS